MIQETINGAKARANLYSLFSRIYLREVDKPFLDLLQGNDIAETLKESGFKFYDQLISKKEEDLLEELAVEYASLFLILPGKKLSPYESVQVGKEAQLGGEAASKVLFFYKKAGFCFPEEHSLLPDHFAVELEFMGHLCDREAAAIERDDKEAIEFQRLLQKEFAMSHLGRWYGQFLGKIEAATEHPFYKELSLFAKEFLDSEVDLLSSQISERAVTFAFDSDATTRQT